MVSQAEEVERWPSDAPRRVGAGWRPDRLIDLLRSRARPWPFIAFGSLFLLALLPRLVGLGLFVTPDEDNWMRRTGNFSRALERGQLDRTYQSGHPGVTTMWVARLGIGPAASGLAGVTGPDPAVTRLPGFVDLLVRARTAVATVNAALVVLIALLAWRLIGPGPAALGGVLMALDPFLIAHSQVVHVDALSTGFIVVAVLAGGLYWWGSLRPAEQDPAAEPDERGSPWCGSGYLALCAVATGLAVVTKAPSLSLGLLLPLIALGSWKLGRRRLSWRALIVSLALCGLGALVTIFLAWPALWVTPVTTITRAIEYTRATAGTPHGPGNFFLGRPISDPGPLFYPYAVAMRMTPPVLAGLVALAVLLPPPALRRPTLLLAGFVLAFALFLTPASKKLDRYALALFPALALLAGLGLWLVWLRVRPRVVPLAFAVVVGLVALAQGVGLYTTYPYPLAYYNPVFGGGPMAQRLILVGWGEGLDQVAAYLNAQPNAPNARIAVYYPLVLNMQAMVAGTVQQYGTAVPADYVVDYVNAAQRGQTPVEVAGLEPVFTARINGIVYARVYQLSPPRVVRP